MKENYKEILDKTLKELEEKHLDFYFSCSKEELNKFIDNYLSNHEIKDKNDFIYMMNCIMKKNSGVYDSHTKVIFNESRFSPLVFRFLDDEIYCQHTDKEHEKYKYSKLLGINNIPIEKLIQEIEQTCIYGTDGKFRSDCAAYLYKFEKLLVLPSINSNTKEITYNLEKNGELVGVSVDITKSYILELDNQKNITYYFKDNAVIFTYSRCREPEEGYFAKVVNQMINDIKKHEVNKFILDLRGNSGGFSKIIEPLINYLEHSDFELVTLVNWIVFSSGMQALVDMKNLGSTVIGTDIASPSNCFGLIGGYINCYEDVKMIYSTEFFYLDENNKFVEIKSKEDLHSLPKEKFVPNYIHPDIYVNETIDDIKNGRDVYLEEALKLGVKKKI